MRLNITIGVNETSSTDVIREHRMKNEKYRSGIALTTAGGRWIVTLVALVSLLLPTLAFAGSPNRWLLIFDTSSSMRNRSKAMEDTMQDLLTTGMHGQIHHGDTIGIWTFNDRLHAGEAPLQIWSPDKAQMIARHTLEYLDALRYGKSANLEEVLTNMYVVVDSSDFITVILFSDGDQLIKGTPFDDEINKQYKDNYRQERKAEMPIVTVFQAKAGNFTTNTVNFGPWPIEIPAVPRPPAPKPVEPQAAPKPPPPQIGPPIIFDGRKTQSAAPDNTTLPVATNVAGIATPAVTQPTVTAAAETPAATQPTTAQTAPAADTATPQPATPAPAATPPPAETAHNQPEAKPAATVAPAVANESQPPPPAASGDIASRSAVTSPPAETATSVPPPNLLSARNLAIASVAFAAIVCGFLLMAARNARKTHSSLITRSLDREQRQ